MLTLYHEHSVCVQQFSGGITQPVCASRSDGCDVRNLNLHSATDGHGLLIGFCFTRDPDTSHAYMGWSLVCSNCIWGATDHWQSSTQIQTSIWVTFDWRTVSTMTGLVFFRIWFTIGVQSHTHTTWYEYSSYPIRAIGKSVNSIHLTEAPSCPFSWINICFL
jgi:hypothetical protein